ncbi:DUF6531 domain-containing protein [Actinokineospora diospyrosa]|uniref:RHS repeat-associated core domain-containing protein n=1 Tax=Actinokineospora diospyrosa TaxID=103728 RepID=A0ABT1IMP4_9PSEU|nr:DUF6531 domain-containing protein [Actinokineospora diospyrosa]MCP2273947.1 RHS repeat-associated core domain-containing protein [Actinokineospora diospyrosa]
MSGYADAVDPVALLNRTPSTPGGQSVQDAVNGAGIEVRAVDWVWRKVVGESLVESIITPITGDFEKIARQAAEWTNVKDALQAIRNNLNSGLTELSQGWHGAAYERFGKLIGVTWTAGLEADAQAAALIGMALRKVADGSRRACDQALKLIKQLVRKLFQAAAMLPIPAVGWARAVKLVYDGIQLYNAIMALIQGIKAIIAGAKQVIDGIRQVGTALSKIKDVRNLNDAINAGNQAADGAVGVKRGADAVRGGAQTAVAGATAAAGAVGSAHDNARGLINERNAARQPDHPTPETVVPGATSGNSARPGQNTPGGANRPADPKNTRTPECNRTTCGDPVDIVTGDVIIGQTDVELAGTLALVVRRTHISSFRAGRLYGRSWASTIDQRLEFDAQGVVYIADDGVILVYPSSTGDVLPITGPAWPLNRDEDGYTITRDGQVLRFTGTGSVRPLSAITDAIGNRIDLHHDDSGVLTGLTHSGGYQVDVDTEAGRITGLRLRDNAGDITLVRYRYSEAGDLAEVLNSSNQALHFEYDTAGRITRWIDRNDQWYRYLYDGVGRCVANQGAGGFLNGTFTYDSDARTTRYTDALGATTVYRYDDRNNVIAETNPLGHTVRSEWDDRDRLVAHTDPLGNVTRNHYDDAGRLVAVAYPNGTEATVGYDDAGRPARITDPDGAHWWRQYDDSGRIAAITDPSGAVTRTAYQPNQIAVTDPLGATTRVLTDAAGLPVAVTDPLGATTQYVRDALGRVARIIDPLGGTVVLSWTIEGKLISHTAPDGAVTRWRYDGEGNQVEHIDPLGSVTRTEITHFDLPAARTAPDGTRLEFGYDPRLKLTSVTNAAGQVWRYEYDAAGNLVRESDFHGRTLSYEQDAAGRLVRRTNGAGETVEFTRDVLGNAVEKRAGASVSAFEFDPVGRLLRATNADADVRYTRDALGRVLSETCDGRAVTSEYDAAGRRTRRTTSSGAVSTWEYDGRDRLVNLTTAGQTVHFGYDAVGREVQRSFGDGAALGQIWDSSHRLTGQTVTTASGRVQNRRYHYRGDGLVVGIDDTRAGNSRYDLDTAGRITGVHTAGWTENHAYDQTGARVAAPDGPRYRHDAQGRVVTRTRRTLSGQIRSWNYTWDAEDRLTQVVTPDGVHWRYTYDALGRRTGKQRLDAAGAVVERVDFTWDGVVLAEQSTVAGVTTWECLPGDIRPLTQTVDERFYALVTDLIGTPTEMLDRSGDVAWRATTSVWGVQAGEDAGGCPLRFPGQYHDAETGQHYNYMRYYDPETGRYTSHDPLGLLAGPDPTAYPANPLIAADPLGLVPCTALTQTGPNTYQSPGGLVYGPDNNPNFGNRYNHVMNHTADIPNRQQHGVFNATNGNEVVRLVDNAYARVQQGGVVSILQPNGNTSHYVNMGQPVGYVGGIPGGLGGNPQVSYIQLVTRNGNEVISAFPVSGIPSSVLGSGS